ncbi:prothymosin alpha [Phascolarctos cinereus]|uniref:Prothymosin alpha n=1 Tax=Phascolarctos cinereus TaxID=38626 RepID=A0A6P5J9D5_PHACI|nr:prothymosin alpha [Phascolarctos cinereus]
MALGQGRPRTAHYSILKCLAPRESPTGCSQKPSLHCSRAAVCAGHLFPRCNRRRLRLLLRPSSGSAAPSSARCFPLPQRRRACVRAASRAWDPPATCASGRHRPLEHPRSSGSCPRPTMSDTAVDTSSEISTKDLKEKKEVVEETENGRDAPANGNANEENGEQEADNEVDEEEEEGGEEEDEEEEGDGEEEDGDEDDEAETATGKRAAEDDEEEDVDTKKQKTDEDD